jgi:predicted AAA+ superfamily ATPase
MFRFALSYLENQWLPSQDRKPLIIRGARQVGKTWVARSLAKNAQKKLIEINFERDPHLKSIFHSNNPKEVLQTLELYFGSTIDPNSCLLFLDEIQEAAEILAKLRWFYEEIPALPVIAAGSLLEFIIQDHAFSMPVGRVTYMHLEPLSFEEFLHACGHEKLLEYIQTIELPFSIPPIIHEKLQESFRTYLYVGGMPGVLNQWISKKSIENVIMTQEDLLATYRDDFFKYKGRIDVERLDKILKSVPKQLGEKFVYAKVDPSIQAAAGKQILSLFNKARLCYSVESSSANGVPLSAEVKEKAFKEIFLDVGLVNRALGNTFPFGKTIIQGRISEQVVGQLLRTVFPFYAEPRLYYWQQDKNQSNAEIDYVIAHENQVIPIEVKSGSTGNLKSLHLFMKIKNFTHAVRINDDLPSITPVNIKSVDSEKFSYTLLSIPFYLTGQIHRLLSTIVKEHQFPF